jgi:hypothetical protein
MRTSVREQTSPKTARLLKRLGRVEEFAARWSARRSQTRRRHARNSRTYILATNKPREAARGIVWKTTAPRSSRGAVLIRDRFIAYKPRIT